MYEMPLNITFLLVKGEVSRFLRILRFVSWKRKGVEMDENKKKRKKKKNDLSKRRDYIEPLTVKNEPSKIVSGSSPSQCYYY